MGKFGCGLKTLRFEDTFPSGCLTLAASKLMLLATGDQLYNSVSRTGERFLTQIHVEARTAHDRVKFFLTQYFVYISQIPIPGQPTAAIQCELGGVGSDVHPAFSYEWPQWFWLSGSVSQSILDVAMVGLPCVLQSGFKPQSAPNAELDLQNSIFRKFTIWSDMMIVSIIFP